MFSKSWTLSQIAVFLALLRSPLQVDAATSWDPTYSFGHSIPISQDGRNIPNFQVIGEPKIFSDRVLLTPPGLGSQRSAVWSVRDNTYNDWTLEVPFRASGPERASGSFHIWYTKDGIKTGTSTVYSAKPFDGLALVVDSYGGRSGSLRGFLNDGSTDYSLHHNPGALGFGHCDLAYRNLGVITILKINYSQSKGLRVETDGRLCFETNKVKLPSGYKFGVSAASADNPDSFELFGFKVTSDQHQAGGHTPPIPTEQKQQQQKQNQAPPIQQKQENQQQSQQQNHIQNQQSKAGQPPNIEAKYEYKDSSATDFKTQEQQFRDVHDRLEGLTHQLAEVQRVAGTIMWKLDQITSDIQDMHQSTADHHSIEKIEGRIANIDHQLSQLDKSVKDTSSHIGPKIDNLHNDLREHHSNLFNALPDTFQQALEQGGPRIGMGVTILIVFQVALVIAYIIYKRRRATAPKKYI